jgi:flagellar hook-length control protein FliK
MADINAATQALINGLSSDAKTRNLMTTDFGSDTADFSAASSTSQFMAVMTTTTRASGASDDSSYSDDVSSSDPYSSSYAMNATNNMQYSYAVKNNAATQQPVQTAQVNAVNTSVADQAAARTRVQNRLKEIAAKDDTPVTDTKALKALQKVAAYLVQANSDGKMALPPQMVQQLKDFLAKGDDLKATDISQFMTNFGAMFRQMTVALPAATTPAAGAAADGSTDAAAGTDASKGLTWPPEVLSALKDLGMAAKNDDGTQPLSILDVMRTVKTLVNASEKAAAKTLDDKSKETALPQDRAALMVVGSAANTAAAATAAAAGTPAAQAASVTTNADTAAAVASVAAAAGDAAKKSAKDVAADKLLAADAKADIAQTVSAPAAKVLASAKELQLTPDVKVSASTLMGAPAKSADKNDATSLTKMVTDNAAQANNNNAAFSDSKRENNAPKEDLVATLAQVKTANVTPATVVAAPPVSSDVKADIVNVSPDASNNVIATGGVTSMAASITAASEKATVGLPPSGPQLPSAATQQVMAQIQLRSDKSSSISVQLSPAELGQVEIRLNIKSDGQVHTVVMADKPETLALLQKDSSQLERSLQQAGLNANSENMSFNLRDQNQAQQSNQGRKRFSRQDLGNTVTEVALTVAPEGQVFTDNRVNYHA